MNGRAPPGTGDKLSDGACRVCYKHSCPSPFDPGTKPWAEARSLRRGGAARSAPGSLSLTPLLSHFELAPWAGDLSEPQFLHERQWTAESTLVTELSCTATVTVCARRCEGARHTRGERWPAAGSRPGLRAAPHASG